MESVVEKFSELKGDGEDPAPSTEKFFSISGVDLKHNFPTGFNGSGDLRGGFKLGTVMDVMKSPLNLV